MQVLAKNPWAKFEVPVLLKPTFWSQETYYLDEDVSFSDLLMIDADFAPFMSLDMKISFMINLLKPQQTLRCVGLDPLALIGCFFQTKSHIVHDTDEAKLSPMLCEYLPESAHKYFSKDGSATQQVLYLNQEPNFENLQFQLAQEGSLLLVRTQGAIAFSPHPRDFEAWGCLWPLGESTEFGWRFTDDTVGLEGLEFARFLKK